MSRDTAAFKVEWRNRQTHGCKQLLSMALFMNNSKRPDLQVRVLLPPHNSFINIFFTVKQRPRPTVRLGGDFSIKVRLLGRGGLSMIMKPF